MLDKLDNRYSSFEYLAASNNKKDIKNALQILNEIKILDPACGSGAFLIKASDIIFGLKRRLYYELKEKKNYYDLRLDIITSNIYGVDILSGAVEISKLRLWLWLISDYDSNSEVEPLPNIEYNLMQGNSLIGFTSFKGKLIEVSKKIVEKTLRFEELKQEYKKSHGKKSELLRSLIEKEMKSVRTELNSLFIQDLNSRGLNIFKTKKEIQVNFFGKKANNSVKHVYIDEFENTLHPFHWVLEFSEIFKGNQPGFDVIIGNPPYGNILKDTEKIVISTYVTANASEIAANFIERSINLMKTPSEIGLIVANSICINKSTNTCRQFLKASLEECKFALFGTRPAKIFEDAEIRAMILLGKKSSSTCHNPIFTTEAIKFTQKQKDTLLNDLCFENTEGLELGENEIGDGTDTSLPKVGNEVIRNILIKLRNKSKITFNNVLTSKSNIYLELRKTGGYWLNALENMPYDSTKIERMYFENELYRDFAIILINSSTFYLYWSTYGNLRDLPPQMFYKFPAPSLEFLNSNKQEINLLRKEIEKKLLKYFESETGRVGEFRTAKCKDAIDKIDKLISKFYGFSENEVKYIISYDSHIRPNNSGC